MAHGRYNKERAKLALSMTSIMDMMTIILCYLIRSFAAEGQLMTNSDNLILPLSTSRTSPSAVNLGISITSDWILVDNTPVVRTAEVRKQEAMEITPMIEKLQVAMAQEERMVKIGMASRVTGEAVVQADKNIEYDIIFKTIFSCGQVGYNHVKFAVMSKEGD
jgi:biopolymer transport protein ExbD